MILNQAKSSPTTIEHRKHRTCFVLSTGYLKIMTEVTVTHPKVQTNT